MKWLKGVHVALVGAAFGGMVATTALLAVKVTLKTEAHAGLDLAVYRLFNGPVSWAFFGLIGTSFVYGLFTEWGFARFWWVIVKWKLLVLMFAVSWLALGPAVNGLASLSDAGYHLGRDAVLYRGLGQAALLWSAVTAVLMLAALFVSVLKPWGRFPWAVPVRPAVVRTVALVLTVLGLAFGVFGLVMQSRYRARPVKDSRLAGIRDGVYRGSAEVAGFRYVTEVTVRRGRIESVRAVENRAVSYAYYAEGVFRKIVRDQNANTDAVTGATTTSRALMLSVENALDKAGQKNEK